MIPTPVAALRLALVQMRVEPGALEANLARATAGIHAARSQGADVVLLPEVLDCGWTHPAARTLAGPIPDGTACRRLREAARAAGVYVCAGLAERAGGELFNAAVLLGPDGALLLHHRKIHELAFARQLYGRGDRVQVVQTPVGCLGVMICADAFVPGLAIGRTLGHLGAELILSPCAWAVPADHDPAQTPYGQLWLDSYQPVAREFGLTIAGCSNVGPVIAGEWAGWRCIGCSLVIGPDGVVAGRAGYGEGAEELLIVEGRGLKRT